MLRMSLNFSNIACSDGGSYKCIVQDSGIDTNATTTLAIRRRCSFLILYERLLFFRFSNLIHYLIGITIVIFCLFVLYFFCWVFSSPSPLAFCRPAPLPPCRRHHCCCRTSSLSSSSWLVELECVGYWLYNVCWWWLFPRMREFVWKVRRIITLRFSSSSYDFFFFSFWRGDLFAHTSSTL